MIADPLDENTVFWHRQGQPGILRVQELHLPFTNLQMAEKHGRHQQSLNPASQDHNIRVRFGITAARRWTNGALHHYLTISNLNRNKMLKKDDLTAEKFRK